MDFLLRIFDPTGFPPRWFCGEWTQFHGWLYVSANLAIWAAYTTIPMLLVYFLSKRQDVPFLPIFWLFACFIYACGTTHLIDALIFWWPVYRFAAVMLFITAVVSWITVLALVPNIPKALSLKSPRELEREIIERRKAEQQLQAMNDNLEKLVVERTRELEAANAELEAFSYSVSHDLKAPLRHLEFFSHSLQTKYTDMLDEGGQDYLGRIRKNALQMDGLIDGMLKLSRLNRGELNLAPTSLSSQAEDIARVLDEQHPRRGLCWKIRPDVVATGDPVLLRQVMENLLSNAWKYTRNNPKPEIEIGRISSEKGTPVYYVRDNGIGFDMKDAKELFVPFKRLDYAQQYEGSGIGLATVQRIIHRHGGRIWAEGTPNGGASFFFTLNPTRIQKKASPDEETAPLPPGF